MSLHPRVKIAFHILGQLRMDMSNKETDDNHTENLCAMTTAYDGREGDSRTSGIRGFSGLVAL